MIMLFSTLIFGMFVYHLVHHAKFNKQIEIDNSYNFDIDKETEEMILDLTD